MWSRSRRPSPPPSRPASPSRNPTSPDRDAEEPRSRAAAGLFCTTRGSAAPVGLLQAHGLAGALTEDVGAVVLPVVVAGHRVDGRARLLGRLDRDVPVAADARTRRDQLADDHVLLEAEQAVALALDRGVGENLRRLLEG